MLKHIKHKKVVAFALMLCFTISMIKQVVLISPAQAAAFSDISGHWAYNDILQMESLSIVKGYGGKFNPGGGVTRAEFTAIIVTALGYGDQARITQRMNTGYKDVQESHWASGFITVASEKGIITGYPDGTFKPAKLIRRDEITSIVARAMNLSADHEDVLNNFTDRNDIPAWAKVSISAAYNTGLVFGFPDGSFKPDRFASRGEIAVLIKNVLTELGRVYTIYAQINKISADGKSMILNVTNQITRVEMTANITVLAEGRITGSGTLKVGDFVFVNLDDNGKVTYIERTDATYAKIGGFTGREEILSVNSLKAVPEMTAGPLVGCSSENIETVLISTADGKASEVSDTVIKDGGHIKVMAPEVNFLVAEVEGTTFEKLLHNPQVLQVMKNRPVEVTRTWDSSIEETANLWLANNKDDGIMVNVAKSLEISKRAIGVNDFVDATTVDGSGQIIAIIDTGIDPGHPDLQKTSSGSQKIAAWLDFSGEGDIDTSFEVMPDGEILHLVNGDYRIGSIHSKSSRFHYGFLQEKTFSKETGKNIDLNFNGNTNDIFTIIVVDSKISGQYDRVYLDTDGDQDFSDEKGLATYDVKPDYTGFKSTDGKNDFNLAVTRIEKSGREINVGFDGNDHGTHVAGIASANGTIQGVAPGAQVMALKVLNSAGIGNPYSILADISEALIYAARNGARIINMSFGFLDEDSESSLLEKLIADISEKYGVLFITVAGNNGPGLHTVTGPRENGNMLSVGAFSSPEIWRTNYGWNVPESNLVWFSSIGPRADGSPAVSVVAPGTVVSTIPLRNHNRYYLFEGTSMAAPHVAGIAALLLDAAARNKLRVSSRQLKKAIEKGARPIPGYSAVEQGFGIINAAAAWDIVQSIPHDVVNVVARTYNLGIENASGILAREYLPGRLTLYLSDRVGLVRTLELSSTDFWICPEQQVLNIPAYGIRGLNIDLQLPDQPGLYCAYLTGIDLATSCSELNVLATVVKPYVLESNNDYRVTVEDTLTPAKYKRYFFRVVPGSDRLQIKLSVPDGAGRVRMFLYGPNGYEELGRNMNFAGVNPNDTVESVKVSVDFPAAGTWELVVYSSASLSSYSLKQSIFKIDVAMEGVKPIQLPQKNRDILVSVLPKGLTIGKKTYITVQVRDRYTLKPFEGLLEINGITYFTRQGRVLLSVEPHDTVYPLLIKSVIEPASTIPLEYHFSLPVS